jgi:multiple sugar transport system ATP-binding protein
MKEGTLQQLDTPAVLYEDPVNLFVAGFIGSPAMNVVPARLNSADGRVFASFGDHRLAVPEAALGRRPGAGPLVASGGEVALGIRPEDLEDAEFAAGAGADEILEVTVDLAEPLGAETIAHFDAVAGVPFTARLSPRTTVRAGRRVKLAVDVDRLHLFDPVSGESLR